MHTELAPSSSSIRNKRQRGHTSTSAKRRTKSSSNEDEQECRYILDNGIIREYATADHLKRKTAFQTLTPTNKAAERQRLMKLTPILPRKSRYLTTAK